MGCQLAQTELEHNGRTVIQGYCVNVCSVGEKICGGNIENPLLSGRVPAKCRIWIVRINHVLHRVVRRTGDNPSQEELGYDARCSDGHTVSIANTELSGNDSSLLQDARSIRIERRKNHVAGSTEAHRADWSVRDSSAYLEHK